MCFFAYEIAHLGTRQEKQTKALLDPQPSSWLDFSLLLAVLLPFTQGWGGILTGQHICCVLLCLHGCVNWSLTGEVFRSDGTAHRGSVTRSLCVIFQLKQSDLVRPATGQADKYVKVSLTLQSPRKGRLVFLPSEQTRFTVQTAHAARRSGQRGEERESWLTGFTSRLPLLRVHTQLSLS